MVDRQIGRQTTERQTETGRQTINEKKIEKNKGRLINGQKQTDTRTERRTDRQINKQI